MNKCRNYITNLWHCILDQGVNYGKQVVGEVYNIVKLKKSFLVIQGQVTENYRNSGTSFTYTNKFLV